MNRNAFLTRAEASKVTGVSKDTIGKWHARGWINREGERQRLTVRRRKDRKLEYRLGDILDAERDTRNNPNSRRGSRRVPAQMCAALPAPAAGGAPEPVGGRARPQPSFPAGLPASIGAAA